MMSLGYNYSPPIEVKKIIACVADMKSVYPLSSDELSSLIDDIENFKNNTIETYELTKLISKNKAFMSGDDHVARRKLIYSNFDFSFFFNTIGNNYTFGYGAIFVASKKNILFYPKSFWENLYSTFQDVKPAAGWGLEKMWKYILSDRYIMLNSLKNIPDLKMSPLRYVMEKMNLKHKPNTLWIELGASGGKTINYISSFTRDKVYGFDSFEGLPEKWREGFDKGMFSANGVLPEVNSNVVLIKGWFDETLNLFVKSHKKRISFIHFDCDLYSSTKCALETFKNYIDKGCIMVFDEFLNFPGFENNSELRAFYEFAKNYNVKYEWIGMNGKPLGMSSCCNEKVALIINSIG
jgi:hypothetical protein